MRIIDKDKSQAANQKPIPLFYWSEIKFILRDKENYGDLLSKYLVERISGRPVKFVHPKKLPWYRRNKEHYLVIGSILHHATENSFVWGSGIIDRKHPVALCKFGAVRGPQTRKFLLNLGYECPEIYGDPAILLPKYFNPNVEKKFAIGILPHYHDYKEVAETFKDELEILVIDMMCMDIEAVTKQILQCKKTISSSLHGLIVSHAYQIPSVWVQFSTKLFGDGVKFVDYLESVGLQVYKPEFLKEKKAVRELENFVQKHPSLPEFNKIKELQKGLIDSCPFSAPT